MDTIEAHLIGEDWKQYNLYEYGIKVNNIPTNDKLIVKDGIRAGMVTKMYKVLPNEEVIKVADEVAEDMGLKKFYEFIGKEGEGNSSNRGHEWFNQPKDFKHVLFDHKKAQVRMHSLYVFGEQVEIGKGDLVNLGVSVNNSIDGKSSFGASLFSFRKVCSNMFWHLGTRRTSRLFASEVRNEVVSYVYRMHSNSLDTSEIRRAIQAVMDSGVSIVNEYKKMLARKFTQDQAILVVQTLRKQLVKDKMPYIKVDDKSHKIELVKAPTVWEAFNDVTAWIWHNERSQLASKMHQMKLAERIFMQQVKRV